MKIVLVSALLVSAVVADVYFKEKFDDGDGWEKRWVQSTAKKEDEAGKFVLTAGKFYGDAEADKGIQTSQDARFYGLSSEFKKPFSNKDKPLVVQFTVKHEQNIDCGGGYVKLFDCALKQADMHGESPYQVMFGPDICGSSTKKVHVIFSHKGENFLIKKDIKAKDDVYTHLYTLILNPDNSYEVLVDDEKVESGDLESDWSFLPPKKIKDPEAKKPEDWDDREKIPDPEDTKPEDWDKPEHVADPEATKPDDWDDEMDGEWEPPMIDNPEYKGEWKPKQIDNPDYSGKWVHPEIDNPEYDASEAKHLAKYDEICKIGFDLWQVRSGTIFDNIIVTDDPAEAKKFAEDTWAKTKVAEKKMKEEQDEEERKKMEEEAKNAKPEDEDEDEDDEDLDDMDDLDEGDSDKAEEHDEL